MIGPAFNTVFAIASRLACTSFSSNWACRSDVNGLPGRNCCGHGTAVLGDASPQTVGRERSHKCEGRSLGSRSPRLSPVLSLPFRSMPRQPDLDPVPRSNLQQLLDLFFCRANLSSSPEARCRLTAREWTPISRCYPMSLIVASCGFGFLVMRYAMTPPATAPNK